MLACLHICGRCVQLSGRQAVKHASQNAVVGIATRSPGEEDAAPLHEAQSKSQPERTFFKMSSIAVLTSARCALLTLTTGAGSVASEPGFGDAGRPWTSFTEVSIACTFLRGGMVKVWGWPCGTGVLVTLFPLVARRVRALKDTLDVELDDRRATLLCQSQSLHSLCCRFDGFPETRRGGGV
jgi:hypothetical protein